MHAPMKGAEGWGAQTSAEPHAFKGILGAQVSTRGDHTTGGTVLTGTEGVQLPPVGVGSALQAKDA
jgi:hypothetical protein